MKVQLLKVQLLFLMLDEHPHQIYFLCPLCQRHNNRAATAELWDLSCDGCGIRLDGAEAEIEVLRQESVPARDESQYIY